MKIIRAAGLFLVNKKYKILVGHPSYNKPNFWSIPKGKVDGYETLLEAAVRETYEETNVKLFTDLHDFFYVGKSVYKHKRKEITMFTTFEEEHANWDRLHITCNSMVPKEEGGFPEMDAFKWVSIDEARSMLHETQANKLDSLSRIIRKHKNI